jgi:hypothetical protein
MAGGALGLWVRSCAPGVPAAAGRRVQATSARELFGSGGVAGQRG